jgi:hypothetical protein
MAACYAPVSCWKVPKLGLVAALPPGPFSSAQENIVQKPWRNSGFDASCFISSLASSLAAVTVPHGPPSAKVGPHPQRNEKHRNTSLRCGSTATLDKRIAVKSASLTFTARPIIEQNRSTNFPISNWRDVAAIPGRDKCEVAADRSVA